MIDREIKAGIEPLVVLAGVPAWASTHPEKWEYLGPGSLYPPTDVADWQEYCKQTAQHFKGRVKYYEVWNEPNGNGLQPKASSSKDRSRSISI